MINVSTRFLFEVTVGAIFALFMVGLVVFLFFFALWLMITGAIGVLGAFGQIIRILLGGR
jgi:hypothetical protein